LLIVVVAGAYLAAHFAAEWLADRFLIVSGAEYLLLGALLGPQVSGVIQATSIDGFAPFFTLALGWVGALVGVQFALPDLLRLRASRFRLAFTESLLTLLFMTVSGAVLIWGLFGSRLDAVVGPAVALGSIAVSSAPAGIAVMARHLGAQGPLVRQLQVSTAVNALVSISAFGVLLALSHSSPISATRPPTPTEWVAITLAIGIGGGVLFHLFLGPGHQSDRLFVALSGALILSSGAAAYLRLSPLLTALLVGVVLVNTSPARNEIRQVLIRVERPLYFVLLIFAGAAWRPGTDSVLIFTSLFIVLRIIGKLGAAYAAASISGVIPILGRRWGWGLVGHGGLAVAVALNYRLHDQSPVGDAVFTAALASVLVTDFVGARLVQALLRTNAPPGLSGSATPSEAQR
jgi:Kef-type K+ transport system membrane component KefB